MAEVPATQDLERVADSQSMRSAGPLFCLLLRWQEEPGPCVSPVGGGEGRGHMPLSQAVLPVASYPVPTALSCSSGPPSAPLAAGN